MSYNNKSDETFLEGLTSLAKEMRFYGPDPLSKLSETPITPRQSLARMKLNIQTMLDESLEGSKEAIKHSPKKSV
jgi:hypothetical protein